MIIERDGVRITVVRTIDEFFQVISLRSRVFMNEQHCPYREEFDGNDLSGATHLLAFMNGEPVGTVRLRWFADFMKTERVAVLRTSRGGHVAAFLFEAAALMGQKKGYARMIGHARPRVAKLWQRLDIAHIRPNRSPFSFSGQDYVEMECEIDHAVDRLSIDSPPHILNRPEGDWDQPGILEATG